MLEMVGEHDVGKTFLLFGGAASGRHYRHAWRGGLFVRTLRPLHKPVRKLDSQLVKV